MAMKTWDIAFMISSVFMVYFTCRTKKDVEKKMSSEEERLRDSILGASDSYSFLITDSFSPIRDTILSHLDLESMLACTKAYPDCERGILSSKFFRKKVANKTLIDTCGRRLGDGWGTRVVDKFSR